MCGLFPVFLADEKGTAQHLCVCSIVNGLFLTFWMALGSMQCHVDLEVWGLEDAGDEQTLSLSGAWVHKNQGWEPEGWGPPPTTRPSAASIYEPGHSPPSVLLGAIIFPSHDIRQRGVEWFVSSLLKKKLNL